MMVGTSGQTITVPRQTKKHALAVLLRVQWHLKRSGQPGHQRFDNPAEVHAIVQKLVNKVTQMWARKAVTPPKELQRVRKMKRRVRRVQYQNSLQVFTKASVPVLRQALPKIHGQGRLRKPVAVHPYRAMDTFLGGHAVNVYRQGNRFDVIDALCNIPILAGLTRQGLKKVVTW